MIQVLENMTKHNFFILLKHLFIWVTLIFLLSNSNLVWGWTIGKGYDTLWVQIYGALTNAAIFYFTSFYLIPRLFNQQKRRSFILQSIGFLLVISLIELFFDYQIGDYYRNKNYQGALELETWNFFLDGFFYLIPINIAYFIIAFAYRGPIDRKEMYERELIFQREKLESELQILKSQVHPHTLFNGLSSIYHLIDLEPPKAKSLVLNLSNALRYHLYESSDEFVPLSKELVYLRQYIALNQVRIEDDAEVVITFDDFEGELMIAPLLFTPFVENAFKYVSQFSQKEKNKINIDIKVIEQTLYFYCTNTIDKGVKKVKVVGGIGLENVRSRLALIYGEKHEINIKEEKANFIVQLKIPLKETL